MANHDFKGYPRLRAIVDSYEQRARAELFDTPEACTEYVRRLRDAGKPVPATKLNYVYTDMIMQDEEARDELYSVVGVKA